jgi:hypothetical protein
MLNKWFLLCPFGLIVGALLLHGTSNLVYGAGIVCFILGLISPLVVTALIDLKSQNDETI